LVYRHNFESAVCRIQGADTSTLLGIYWSFFGMYRSLLGIGAAVPVRAKGAHGAA